MTGEEDSIVTAARRLADVLNPNWDMLDTSWPTFTCEEAEAFVDLFLATGHDGLALSIREAHTMTDQPGDLHYPEKEPA